MSNGRQDAAVLERLVAIFQKVNAEHFDGFLDAPVLRWNPRLRSSAGRFFPGSRKFWKTVPPVIEIASYLETELNAEELICDTMAHEMIHYWLWVRRKPYGHTPEFHLKMRQMGVSRYNRVPRPRPYRYIYKCEGCGKEFPVRRKLGLLACAACCDAYSNGKYDPRFDLLLYRIIDESEALQLAQQTV